MEQQHPADTRGPPVPLDEESVRALFPPAMTRWDFSRRELASALGREGAKFMAVCLACALVLAYGAVVITRAWVSEERAIPLLLRGPHLNLAVLWYVFAAAVGICGWLLSGQVTKPWLRTFVGVGLLIAAVLLMTIGRSAHVGAADAEARSEARRLLAAAGAAEVDHDEGAGSALLWMLCTRGDLAPAGRSDDTTDGSKAGNLCTIDAEDGSSQIMPFVEDRLAGDGSDDARHGEQLACLPGWTVDTFVEWMDAASRDRQVAALSALASCEIGVVNPVAEEEAEDEIDTTTAALADDPGSDAGSDAPSDPGGPATAGDASTAAPGEDGNGAGGAGEDGGDPEPEAVAAVREALLVQRSEVKGQEAVAAGADELLTFASGSTTFAQLRFSAAAWLVVLAATLLWYRRLEIRAGVHRLGPVDVQFDEPGDKGSGHGEAKARPPANRAEAVFKESVIRNVPEPGAIPGGEALAPVGDLVAQTDMPHRTLIGGVIEAARTILATRGGFTVIFSVRPSDDRKEHVAFVRLRDTRTGNHLASRIVHDESEEQAARRAGYWIAGWIISRSDFVPRWAKWSEDDAAGFPPLPPAWSAGVQPAAQRSVAPKEFDRNAVNSLILAQRAYAHQTTHPRDTAGDAARVRGDRTGTGDRGAADHTDRGRRNHLAALEDFARAVHRQRRYPVARYRRGAALGTMMFRGGDLAAAAGLPDGASDESWQQVVTGTARLRYLFGDLITGDRVRPRPGGGRQDDRVEGWITRIVEDRKPFPDDMRLEMLQLVAEWTNRNRAALRWSPFARFRPSERSFWKEFHRDGLDEDWKLLLTSEVCLCAERLKFELRGVGATPGANDPPRGAGGARRVDDEVAKLVTMVRARALQADSHWQISYNLACLYSIRSHLWSLLEGRDGVGGDPARSSAACRSNAFEWLERCLDRPHSTQLVQEWVDADGDLAPLRDEPHFEVWRGRVRSMREGPSDRRRRPGKAPEPAGGATSTPDTPAGAPAVLPARPSTRRRRISPSR